MSNATQDPRNPGDSRRRRSRGGSNRNRNNERRNDNHRGDRDSRGGGEPQGRRQGGQRSEEFRPQASRPARTYAPAKLSLWQKFLKIFGIYKEPTRPSRTDRKPESTPFPETRSPKSNTRNARSTEGESRPPREPREPRPPREPREPRAEGERQPAQDRTRGPARGGERPRGGDPKSVESTRVYVGNLSYDVTEQDLQELFKGIGGVRNIEIVYNRSTHRSKGYGFVEMLRMDEAVRAVEVLNDQPFMGRKMTVSGAKSKGQDEREDMEGRTEREPTRVVLAPTNPTPTSAVEPVNEPTAAAIAPVPSAEEAPEPAEVAVDLEAKYSFEPVEKTDEA